MTRTIESHETALTIINESGFYTAHAKPLIQSLALAVAKGTHNEAKAVNAFTRLISEWVNGSKEWRIVYAPWKPTVADRKLAAAEMLDYYSDQIREQAEEMVGPEWVQVVVKDFDHDMYGNPTARHLVFSSTEDGGMVKRLTGSWDPRRAQVGYGDYTDSVKESMTKACLIAGQYDRVSIEGDRSGGEIVVLFKRKAIKVGA